MRGPARNTSSSGGTTRQRPIPLQNRPSSFSRPTVSTPIHTLRRRNSRPGPTYRRAARTQNPNPNLTRSPRPCLEELSRLGLAAPRCTPVAYHLASRVPRLTPISTVSSSVITPYPTTRPPHHPSPCFFAFLPPPRRDTINLDSGPSGLFSRLVVIQRAGEQPPVDTGWIRRSRIVNDGERASYQPVRVSEHVQCVSVTALRASTSSQRGLLRFYTRSQSRPRFSAHCRTMRGARWCVL